MKKSRGLRSVFFPFILASICLVIPVREAAAFTVDTSSVLSEPAGKEKNLFKPDPSEYFRFAVRAKSLGNLKEAKQALLDIRASHPGTPWEKRAAFVLGLIALDEGDGNAISLLEEAIGISAVDDHIVFFQAEALKKSGRFIEAAGAYHFIISAYPSSILKERAAFSRAACLFEAGDNEGAAGAFRQFISGWPKSRQIPEANLTLAKALMKQAFQAEAVQALKEVSTGYPTSAFAAQSDLLLSTLEFGEETTGSFSPAERFRRSENFFVQASYNKALAGYATLLNDGAFRDRALFRTAVAHARLKRYKESEKAIREYLALKDPAREAEALYWLAMVSIRQGREEGVLEAERHLSRDHRKSNERAKVLMLIAGMKKGKDPEGASLAYRAVLDEFSGSPASDEAFWKMGWDAYSSGRFEDAYDNFTMYLDAKPNGSLAGQFIYWQARSAERLGRLEEANVLFKRVCLTSPRSFYCLMAEVRPSVFAEPPSEAMEISSPDKGQAVPAVQVSIEPSPAMAAPVERAFRKDARYRAAQELLLLGLYEQASMEIDLLARAHSSDKASLTELAALLYEARDFYRAFRIYRTHLSSSNERAHLELGFPLRLVESVKEKSAIGAADPYLVAAVMREESHFNPEAVSPVGAMGLMQIMPSTGKQIAKELGEGWKSGGLLEPGRSIRFGSWYLGQLLKRFDGDAVMTIAGYNAGPNAAARWAGVLPEETDEFVESIPYEETRGYVKRVLRSYAEFLKLGNEEFREKVVRPSPTERVPGLKEASNGQDGKSF